MKPISSECQIIHGSSIILTSPIQLVVGPEFHGILWAIVRFYIKNINKANRLFLGTDWNIEAMMYKNGHQINIHTWSHTTSTTTTPSVWAQEQTTVYNALTVLAGISTCAITGSRAPYLQANDAYYSQLQSMGLTWESSMTYQITPGGPAYWPFTLDYTVPNQTLCNTFGVCPTTPHPGFWEFPMTNFDYSIAGNVQDPVLTNYSAQLASYQQNFLDTYNSNKAPRGWYDHWRYFSCDNNFGNVYPPPLNTTIIQFWTDMYAFITNSTLFPDIIFATEQQVLQWMQNPVNTTMTKQLPMFQTCPSKAYNGENSCPNGVYTTCEYFQDKIQICGLYCPNYYPGLFKGWTYFVPNGNTSHWPGVPSTVWLEGTNTSTSNTAKYGAHGYVCSDIYVTNPSTISIATAFKITFGTCNSISAVEQPTWNFPTGYWVNSSLNGFTMVGINQNFLPGSTNYLGGFCLDLNTDDQNQWEYSTYMTMGIDLYAEPVACNPSETSCIAYCGNFQCDTGETATNCPIDCAPITCPSTRRMLWGRKFN